MTLHVKDATIWQTANPKIKDATIWKQVQTGSVKDEGVWKPYFSNTVYDSLNASTTSIGEAGGSVSFTLTASGVPDGTVLYYEICNENGTALSPSEYNVSNTIDNGKPTGTVGVNSNTFTFTVASLNDSVADGSKYFAVKLRTDNQSGPVVVTSPVITIGDAGAPVLVCVLPDLWYCAIQPNLQECQPICSYV